MTPADEWIDREEQHWHELVQILTLLDRLQASRQLMEDEQRHIRRRLMEMRTWLDVRIAQLAA